MVKWFRRYWADMIRHTDTTTDGQSDSNIPQYWGGRYKTAGGEWMVKHSPQILPSKERATTQSLSASVWSSADNLSLRLFKKKKTVSRVKWYRQEKFPLYMCLCVSVHFSAQNIWAGAVKEVNSKERRCHEMSCMDILSKGHIFPIFFIFASRAFTDLSAESVHWFTCIKLHVCVGI